MKKPIFYLFMFFLAILSIVWIKVVYDTTIFYWQNIDMTDARKFSIKWKQYIFIGTVFLFINYAWFYVYYYLKTKK